MAWTITLVRGWGLPRTAAGGHPMIHAKAEGHGQGAHPQSHGMAKGTAGSIWSSQSLLFKASASSCCFKQSLEYRPPAHHANAAAGTCQDACSRPHVCTPASAKLRRARACASALHGCPHSEAAAAAPDLVAGQQPELRAEACDRYDNNAACSSHGS